MKVGYARVSSVDGSQETGLDTQVQILKKNGCEKIFKEMKSGTTTTGRNKLRECLDFVREGLIRDYYFMNNSFVDAYLYSKIRRSKI